MISISYYAVLSTMNPEEKGAQEINSASSNNTVILIVGVFLVVLVLLSVGIILLSKKTVVKPKNYTNPFANSPTSAPQNPFAQPTTAFQNPFGQPQATQAPAANNSYTNPFGGGQ